jgi:hypothetical protein
MSLSMLCVTSLTALMVERVVCKQSSTFLVEFPGIKIFPYNNFQILMVERVLFASKAQLFFRKS